MTEPERQQRWVGTWDGDPTTGTVGFRMTAEGEDVAAVPTTIHVCEPPRRLVVSWPDDTAGRPEWHLEIDLVEVGGVTTMTFAQRVADAATGRDVGPGWEYYLDRLAVAQDGGAAETVAWADYEGMSGYYADLVADLP